jgi:hypothetical protein
VALAEFENARSAVAEGTSTSISRFHVPVEQPTRSFLLLPLQEDADLPDGGVAIKNALRELITGTMGDLWSSTLGGEECEFYDCYVLRTSPGSARQMIHSDTPFQQTPPLMVAFVALQDVTKGMGPTTFLPRTHIETPSRRSFDGQGDGKDAMLGKTKSKFALLKAGDAALFDMRILHGGAANEVDGGAERLMLCVTFRNRAANDVALAHKPCIRAGYKHAMRLSDVRRELDASEPFAAFGSGLL